MPVNLLDQNNKTIENFTKTLFSLIEWLIVLTTLKFVQIKTESFIIGLIFYICYITWIFFIFRKIYNFVKKIVLKKNYNYTEQNLNKKYLKFELIPTIIASIFGIIMGTIGSNLILEIIKKLSITFGNR